MSPIRITARRTVGQARNAYSTAFVFGAFLSVALSYFAFRLNAAEGGRFSAAVVWTSAVSPILPLLAALLGMDVWSDERRSGRLDVMLSSSVFEFDFTMGKAAGTWILLLVATAISLMVSVVLLRVYAPACEVSALSFAVAFMALALQGALWCSVSVMCSAAFGKPAVSACATALLLVAIPRGIWAGLSGWSAKGASAYGEMPLDAHAVDFASGMVPCGMVISYVALSGLALFCAVAFVERRRLVGRAASRARAVQATAVVLACVFVSLLVLLASRFDMTFDIPVSESGRYSDRTLGILSEARGDVTATCFLPRSDERFRPAARTLRALAREAASRGGVRLKVRFVDPSWDVGEASRLVRSGVKPGHVVFAYGHRTTALPVDDGLGERQCASTILRLTMPPQRRSIRWTRGHGEVAFDDYGAFGMSDIARELSRDGYHNQPIDLAVDAQIPSDCALIVVAGAREEFSRAEISRLDAYLRQGGRLLVLMNADESGGVKALLPAWGLNIAQLKGFVKTVSGSDVVVSDFADHPVTAPIRGMSVLLDNPVAFTPSSAVETSASADRIVFTCLARTGSECVAAVVERGAETGADLDFRPTRIVAVGDAAFVMNAQLAVQANANGDFFMNAVAYLAGSGALTASGRDRELLVTGMDRAERRRFAVMGAVVVPLVVTVFLALVAFRRRRRE